MERRPLVSINGRREQLPAGDTLPGATFVFESEEEFLAAEADIPEGARVVKMWEPPYGMAGVMIVPDYAAMESQNRVTTTGGTWTADRTGFVFVQVFMEGGNNVIALINNKVVIRKGQGDAGTDVFAVSKGDVVDLRNESSTGAGTLNYCVVYFIPPKFVAKELPVVVEKNGSYSLDEIKTADTWIDGKPIYKKTVEFGYMPNTGVQSVTHGVAAIDRVVDMRGVAIRADGLSIPLPQSFPDPTSNVSLNINKTRIEIITGMDRTDRYAYVTFYYTKTTD
jgi:hypothetical protein